MNLREPVLQKPSILVVDDDQLSVEALRRALKREFQVFIATNTKDAENILRFEYIQVVISDHRMPDETGVQFLTRVRDEWPNVIRILISGYSNHSDTVKGINDAGIFQYIEKPWDPERIILTLKNAVELFELQRQNHLLAVELKVANNAVKADIVEKQTVLKKLYSCTEIIRSPNGKMDQIIKKVCQIANFDFPILITGKSGSGKELIAKAIHYNSHRSEHPFIAENCGALPDQLLESELFGYKKGAFTGAYMDHIGLLEQANHGTLFLDEIGEISPAFQVKLLRVLQEQEVRPLGQSQSRKINVRILAATNRNLEEEVKAGRFREDLFYRLAGYLIHLPDLHERPEDIQMIANEILSQMCQHYQRANLGFEKQAMDAMLRYRWPGNVREMQNEIARMFMLTPETESLRAEFLSPRVLVSAPEEMEMEMHWLSGVNGSLKEKVSLFEKQIIREALIRLRWNRTNVAAELGLSRVGLRKKMVRYGLEDDASTDFEDDDTEQESDD
jgi:two-component system response regulator HupR/HoxA